MLITILFFLDGESRASPKSPQELWLLVLTSSPFLSWFLRSQAAEWAKLLALVDLCKCLAIPIASAQPLTSASARPSPSPSLGEAELAQWWRRSTMAWQGQPHPDLARPRQPMIGQGHSIRRLETGLAWQPLLRRRPLSSAYPSMSTPSSS